MTRHNSFKPNVIACCLFVLKVLLLFYAFLGTHIIRLAVIISLTFLILPFDFWFNKHFHKKLWSVTLVMLVLLVCITIPLRNRLESIRFSLIDGIYTQAAHNILTTTVPMCENAKWCEESVPWPEAAIVGSEVMIDKTDTQIVLYFPTYTSFFNTYGMLYFYPAIPDCLKSIDQYECSLDPELSYDCIGHLKDNWYYAKLY